MKIWHKYLKNKNHAQRRTISRRTALMKPIPIVINIGED